MEIRIFYDSERDCFLSLSALRKEYNESGDTEHTFGQFLSACMAENNGTLEEIRCGWIQAASLSARLAAWSHDYDYYEYRDTIEENLPAFLEETAAFLLSADEEADGIISYLWEVVDYDEEADAILYKLVDDVRKFVGARKCFLREVVEI